MARKSRFAIPTLDEMESGPSVSFKAKDLMAAQKEADKEQPKLTGSGDMSAGPKQSPVITKTKEQISSIRPLGDDSHRTSQATATVSKNPAVNSSCPEPSVKPKPPWIKPGSSPQKPSPSKITPGTSKPTMMYKPVNVMEKKDGTETVVAGSGATGSPTKLGKISILVSPRQRGNPILKFVRNVPWEFDDIVPDYQLGRTTCALFLSLRYHQLNPDYVHERLKKLGHSYDLRILLVHIDVKDPHHSLKELAKVCILSDCTLMVAFSPEEAGRYLETYKSFENKPPDLIMEKTEGTFLSKFTDSITSVKKVNKTDAMTLLSTFGTFEKIANATEEDLSLCSGFGPQKAQQLHKVMNEPFLKPNKRKLPIQDDAAAIDKSSKKSPEKGVS